MAESDEKDAPRCACGCLYSQHRIQRGQCLAHGCDAPRPDESTQQPTCRACYAATLTSAERERFYAEPVTSCIYWCPDHQRAMDDVLQSLPQVQYIQATMATFEPPMFALAEHDCSTCADCIHDGHKCCGCYDGACCQEVRIPPASEVHDV